MKNSFLFRMCVIHVCCTVMNVCFVLFLFCLHQSVCVWLQVQGLLREWPKHVRSNYKVIPVSNVFPSIHVAYLWICVVFFFSFVCMSTFAYVCESKVHCGRAQLFDSAVRLQVSLSLRTTCILSWCNWIANSVMK